MVGITLSSEQVKNAPPEVRRWLEQEVLTAFDWHLPAAEPNEPQLAACTVEEAFKILASVRDMLPVANAFLAFGHDGVDAGVEGIAAFRVTDVMRHAHLSDPRQVVACLDVINEAFCRVRGDASAVLCGLDDRGYCFIADATQQSVARVWQQTMAPQNLRFADTARTAASPAPAAEPPAYAPYAAWAAHPQAGNVAVPPANAGAAGPMQAAR